MDNDLYSFIKAIEEDAHESIKQRLSAGFDVNSKNPDSGKMPLHAACLSCKNSFTIELLLEAGADVNGEDNYGNTPLHYLSETKLDSDELEYAVNTLLLEAGADVNKKNASGFIPLHAIISANQTDSAEQLTDLLIKAGSEVNCKTKFGATPRYLAEKNGNEAIINRLIAAGATKPNTKTIVKALARNCQNTRKKLKTLNDKHTEITTKTQEIRRQRSECEEAAYPYEGFNTGAGVNKTMKKEYQKAIKECKKMSTVIKALEKKAIEITKKEDILIDLLGENMCEEEEHDSEEEN
uniref:Uncharacterized protein n=1 Tax=viral metagenome TaxID=1070528 RepID=A0A6C0I4X9_9ZZZZ